MKRTCLAAVMALTVAWGGQFKHGLGRGDSLKVKVPGLPAVRIGRTTLAIDVKDASTAAAAGQAGMAGGVVGGTGTGTVNVGGMPDPAVPVTLLQAALDRVFRESFTIVQGNGEAMLRVAVVHYTMAESRIDTVTQQIRVTLPPGPDGKYQLDPQTGQPMSEVKPIPVENWSVRGQIAVRVEVVDGSGALLDGFAPQASVRGAQLVSVNGQDRVDRTQLPTNEQVREKLIADLVAQFGPRYCPPATATEIPLAVDEELRAGNKKAKEGEFAGAAKLWEAAQMKKGEGEGDRLHNVGAVYEAQGFDLLMKQEAPEKAEPYFQKAAAQYEKAAGEDPKEKYITRASERVRKGMGLIAALKELEGKRQKMLTARANPSAWPPGGAVGGGVGNPGMVVDPVTGLPVQGGNPGQVAVPMQTAVPMQVAVDPNAGAAPKSQAVAEVAPVAVPAAAAPVDAAAQEALQAALADPRADTAQEMAFRQMVRLRIRSAGGAVAEELKQQLEATGPLAYGLTALGAKRVVFQEARDWGTAQPKFKVYKDTYAAFAGDGAISAEERTALKTLAANLGLSEGDVKGLESGTPVKE